MNLVLKVMTPSQNCPKKDLNIIRSSRPHILTIIGDSLITGSFIHQVFKKSKFYVPLLIILSNILFILPPDFVWTFVKDPDKVVQVSK